ncbi:MAG: fumarate hydratase C-terminal domain-containing protein [Coriobacteriia bacterium]|nr:fumarate hydratase C-terminal domain-containing protein [Coriobacteriia bacterium]
MAKSLFETKDLHTPLHPETIRDLQVGDRVEISGTIYCGRDAVLPKIVSMAKAGDLAKAGLHLEGSVIFHSAVSPAGVGPTSSNKLEIEGCIVPLSRIAGVKLHLGKGSLNEGTVRSLKEHESVYAIIPPVSALLRSKTVKSECVAFQELGMEAFYRLEVHGYPAIIAAAHGESIYS